MKERFLNVLAWGVWLNAVHWPLFSLGLYATHEGDGFFGTPPDYMDTFLTLAAVTLLPLVVQWVLFYIVTGSPRILPWSK